jgi:hypothetical protein
MGFVAYLFIFTFFKFINPATWKAAILAHTQKVSLLQEDIPP